MEAMEEENDMDEDDDLVSVSSNVFNMSTYLCILVCNDGVTESYQTYSIVSIIADIIRT